MSDTEIEVTKIAAKTSQVITIASIATTIFMLIMNLDVTSTIFKVIQLITLFDKLRFMNVKIKNSFGDFIEFVGMLFGVNSVYSADYHLAAISKSSKFERADYSTIAYRMKPDKIVMFLIMVILEITIACIINSLKNIDKSDFLKMEKRGKLIRRLNKISSGMFMMVVIDVVFVTGHQILHQKISNLLTKAEYLLTYILSLIIFFWSIWKINSMINTLSQTILQEIQSVVGKAEIEKNRESKSNQRQRRVPGIRGRRPNQNKAERRIGLRQKANPSELDLLGLQQREERGKKLHLDLQNVFSIKK